MRIEDILTGQRVSLMVYLNNQMLEFETTVQDVFPKKHFILLDPIMQGDKAISFRGKGIIVNMVLIDEDKPQLFRNITIQLQKKMDGSLCYQVSTLVESIFYNRRENFRCFVGNETSVQGGTNRLAHPTVIKDVSYTGFAIVCEPDIELDPQYVLHTVLRDRIEEIGENFVFHLYGSIARTQILDNGKVLYGCRLTGKVPGLDKYIMTKERIRLRRTNGGEL